MKLTTNQMDALAALYPEGCDVVEGREDGHLHAQRLEPDEYGGMKGVLIVDEYLPKGGTLGISRETYFTLPEGAPPTAAAMCEEARLANERIQNCHEVVSCPRCYAPVGSRCRHAISGVELKGPHRERWNQVQPVR